MIDTTGRNHFYPTPILKQSARGSYFIWNPEHASVMAASLFHARRYPQEANTVQLKPDKLFDENVMENALFC
jgi:hypothetical protein